MHRTDTGIALSATDLATHSGCSHATELDFARQVRGEPIALEPRIDLRLLQERGELHERAYLAHLASLGLSVFDLRGAASESRVQSTLEAMARGVDVIAQGELLQGRWSGQPDVLLRTIGSSRFGAYAYEVHDTKLARETTARSALQLALYASLLEEAQGAAPEHVVVVAPGDEQLPFTLDRIRVDHLAAYTRQLQRRLEQHVAALDQAAVHTYPEPVPACDGCGYATRCEARRRTDDHISLVARISTKQRRDLARHGIVTLAGLAQAPPDLRLRHGSPASYEHVREQARVQLEGRVAGGHVIEDLPWKEGDRLVGLAALPAPSAGDLFLDLEGDPFIAGGGREYLFGLGDEARYTPRWGLDAAGEKRAFEATIDAIEAAWSLDPTMHVYHYAPYDPSHLETVAIRYGTRLDVLERMNGAHLFVDLFAVVRHAVRASVESYSLKAIEPLFGFERSVPLGVAGEHRRALEAALERGVPIDLAFKETISAVAGYNEDDGRATVALRAWLEARRAARIASGEEIPRPELVAPITSKEADRFAQAARIAEQLRAGIPPEGGRDDDERGRLLLAHLLEWHAREGLAAWVQFRALLTSPPEQLDAPSAVAHLTWLAREAGKTAGCPIDVYEFPRQEVDLREGDTLFAPMLDGGRLRAAEIGKVVRIDLDRGRLAVRRNQKSSDTPVESLVKRETFRDESLREALVRLASHVLTSGSSRDGALEPQVRASASMTGALEPQVRASASMTGALAATLALLFRDPPKLAGGPSELVPRAGETGADVARRIACALDRTVFPVQGPPGTGKTFAGVQMVLALVAAGKRVGVTANSHAVIANFLQRLREARPSIRTMHKVTKAPTHACETDDAAKLARAFEARAVEVVGGTPFLFAQDRWMGAFDVLVVDEAGQMSLANTLAASQAAGSVVLLGDPQQLQQPQQAAHLGGADASALEHLFGGAATVPEGRGLFLGDTWRLPPSMAEFTSELFYDRRLRTRPEVTGQRIDGVGPLDGVGLLFIPVPHEGNASSSREEVAVVETLVARLLRGTWTDGRRAPQALLSYSHSPALADRALTAKDLLVIAPTNAHVGLLRRALGPRGIDVGTVDKFQGREAPVVIYALGASTAEEAPRGLSFLYDGHRLNVATSRARCRTIVLGSPLLFAPTCRTRDDVVGANGLCRLLERATVVAPDQLALEDVLAAE